MYKIKRSEKITETLGLTDENGTVVKTVDIVIDADLIAAEFVKKHKQFIAAQKRLTEAQKLGRKSGFEAAYIEYGSALIDFFCVVFGKEHTLEIADYFGDRYIEMMMQLFPFVNERIIPAIRRSVGYSKKQLKKQWRVK